MGAGEIFGPACYDQVEFANYFLRILPASLASSHLTDRTV
jgi:hypothetical protein